jgi:hypothetical protein
MRSVREEEGAVLSFDGSGDGACIGKLDATWLLTSESFSKSKLDFGGIMTG